MAIPQLRKLKARIWCQIVGKKEEEKDFGEEFLLRYSTGQKYGLTLFRLL